MSEFDDLELLDIQADIQALDEVLALSAKKKSQQHVSSNQQSDVSSNVDAEDDDDYVNYLQANQEIEKSLNAYEINTRLISGLTIAKKKLTDLLEECEQKIRLLDEKLKKSTDESSSNSKLAISNAGIPYFKDKDYFSAPKNIDTKRKEAVGEVFLLNLKKPNRWSGKDREMLLSAINNQAIESVLSGGFNKEINKPTSDNQTKKIKLVLPRNFNEMVGPLGAREFDWHKISVMDFDNKHSPGECRAMWNVYLHPAFKKSEWTNVEDKKLLKCIREYKYQDWDAIAQKLDTNRSAYQCFIRYNTIKKVPLAGQPWTRQEDKHLTKIINAIKIGDYISWSDVANHFRHRTKQQIYVRWMYRKAPHLRKGRFTHQETLTLLKAVQKYGTDFCKISTIVMSHRTSVQLQERYHTVVSNINNRYNVWTLNDDMMLINLQLQYSNDWSKIAKYFSDKTRTQVRHRYNALLRYTAKGVSLETIPRPPPTILNKRNFINKKSSSNKAPKRHIKNAIFDMQPVVNIFDVQLRLYEALCFPLSIKPNNSEELYSIEQLIRDTKKLHSTLNLLHANLDIPDDFLNYVQLNNKEKQLLISLKEYLNIRHVQSNELIEKYSTRMFGCAPEINKGDFFIPPLPFDGHVKLRKIIKNKKNTSINYNLAVNEKFLIDVPADFSITPSVFPLVKIEEEIQFHKFGQFLTSDYHNFLEQNLDLYKSIKCIFSFAKKTQMSKETLLEHNKLNVNSEIKISLEAYEQSKLNKFNKETTNVKEDVEDVNMGNIISPNQATLIGIKNLFLWKLLYDYQHESHLRYELMASFGNESKSEHTATNSKFMEIESAEYQLLRVRLRQLFELPIGLSNTILEVQGPEAIFLKDKPTRRIISTKRKFEDDSEDENTEINPLELNERNNSNVSTDSNSQLNLDIALTNLPRVRSCKIVKKKYKITRK
ncbi:snRNA-activating protein complex subunit 4 [Trachymyrmex cornetzi]|uniref:snRNA-activating protein complex subunit 4 n=1 Tax=Trachymyrmex cornetzi TaxID=471704 RepID=A0A151J2P0_9HYME|nr:snRNA-activating protein complex subunit 4 [Trachymyrmex cornetzi]